MSFTDDYLALRKKRKKQEETQNVAPLFVNKTAALYVNDDIAPVATRKTTVKTAKKEEDRTWFKKGAFEDGYQAGDVTKTILGTAGDLGVGVIKGIAYLGEGVGDLINYGDAAISEKLGYEERAQRIRERTAESVTDIILGGVEKKLDKYSVLGDKADSISQGIGQVGAIIATGGFGASAGLGAAGTTALTTGVMGASSMGSGIGEAYQSGATDEEAATYGLIKGVVDAGSEMIFGGLGKTVKALGLSKGLSSLDDVFARKLTEKITNQTAKNFVQYGVKASAEGVEEVLAGLGSAVGKKLTYMSDAELGKLVKDENLLEQFVAGAVTSGIAQSGIVPGMQGGSLKESIQTGRDFITGNTVNEQKVIDKEYENRVAEQEQNGVKLSEKEKSKIYDAVVSDMERGYISTDTIEEVLGGDTYKSYKDTIESEDALAKEFEELGNKQNATLAEQSRYNELKQQMEDMKQNSQRDQLKEQLGAEVFGLVQNDRLVESYNERGRRRQAFEVDVTKYDSKQQETIKKAVESGILNNTRRTHEFVDMIAKISADKGVLFDFTNNAKLKDSGFAVDGKTVNGYVTEGGVTLNIDSAKSMNSVVGHEITHVLEGTELYTSLQKTIADYAKSKGEYQSRYETLAKLYEGVEGANVDAELTADLVGDYLFTDSDFINHLSTNNRNVFQKIYDEIKYLCKVATAGSKEARELEKVKRAFEKAYQEGGKQSDTKYSVSDKNIKDNSTGYASGETYFTMSYTQDGKVVGTLEYGEYDGEANVKMIEVDPEYRRKGIAKKLMQELQKKYPDTEIDFGMSTPDGTKLLDSITYEVTDEAVVADRQQLKDLKTELNELQEKLDVLYDTDPLTEAQEAELHKLGDRWTEVYDSIRDLEQSLRGKRATKTFVKTDTKYSLSDSDGKQLTKEQQEYFKDSKMRDENGNLKVMYHGSQDAGFHVFDASMSDDDTSFFFVDRNDVAASYSGTTETYEAKTIRTAEDMNNFLAEIGQGEDYSVVEKDGKFILLYEGDRVAASDTAQGIYKEFCWYEGVGEGDANYKVYLNLKNPLEIDAQGRPWNKIDAEFSQEVYDKYNSLTAEEKDALRDLAEWEDFRVFNSEIQEASGDALASAYKKMGEDCNIYDLFSVAADNFSEESMRENARKYLKTRDYAKRAKEQGYDGVIFNNIVDNGGYSNGDEGASTVAIAFESNQIKSVANEKPTADKDIRYSLSDTDYMDAVNRGDTDSAQMMVDEAAKNAGYTVKAYHGTARGDRVGNVFLPERATSGPMAFFTSSKEIAENYARDKADTSMAYDPDYDRYETQFRIKAGSRDIPLYEAWRYLPLSAKRRITEKAGQLREDWDGDNELMLDPDTNEANGGFQWQLKEARGNAIQALTEQWLNSGTLFNEEARFLDVLEMAGVTEEFKNIKGMGELYFKDPDARHEKVYDTYLKINKPFDTANVDEQFVAELEAWYDEQDQDQYVRENMESDMWDKNGIDAYDFAERVRSDIERGTAHAWTSIPDSVTDYLKHLGYDGIKDTGGKNGGESHTVWIPFSSEQVKSAEAVTRDDSGNVIPLSERFNPEKTDIRYSVSDNNRRTFGNYNVYGKDVALETEPEIAPVTVAESTTVADDSTVAAPVVDAENATTTDAAQVSEQLEFDWRELAQTMPEPKSGEWTDEYRNENNAVRERVLRGTVREVIRDVENGMSAAELAQKSKAAIREYEQVQARKPYGEAYTEAERLMLTALHNQYSMYDSVARDPEYVNELKYSLSADDETFESDRLNSLADEDAPPEVEAPYYGDEDSEEMVAEDPFEERDWYSVSSPKVKAYMYENPEVKPFFQAEAEVMLDELANTTKGERWYNDKVYYETGGEMGFGGTKRHTSDSIAKMLDEWNMSYDDIEKGLRAIIEDHGAENIAAAKKVEFMLNERLLDGYKSFVGWEPTADRFGNVPQNQEYINMLAEQQIVNAYSKESFDALMAEADKYVPPISEEIAPVSSAAMKRDGNTTVKESADTIRPKREKQPKLAKATPMEQARADILTEEPKVDKKNGRAWAMFKNNVLDRGMVFEDLSLATGNRELQARWNSIRYAENKAQRMMEKGSAQVSSLKSIRETVENTGKTKQFYEYLYHMLNVDRMTLENRYKDTPNKPVFGASVTAEMSMEAAKKLEQANPRFKLYARDVYNYMTNLREQMVDNGVISKETAELWAEMYPHYVPIRRLGDTGLNINVPLDTRRTGVNAPIKRAKGGSRDILPLFDTMGQRTIQTYKAIAKNRFGVELKNTLGTTIADENVSVDDAIDSVDTHEGLLQEGKNGQKPTFTVFENGKKVTFEITDEMYDAMKPASEGLSYTNKVLNTASNIRRGTLTEYNPWFLLKNAVKDVQDVLVNSQHAARTYASIPKAILHMTTNGHWYAEYLENGGEQNSYFDSQTNTFDEGNKALEIAKKVTGLYAISKANNIIERLPRLAEYIASRESGRSVDVAMLDAARVTTNFAAGGDLTKFLNRNGVTFLNASVQGALQQARNIREAKMNGLKGWASLAGKFVIAGLPAIALNHLIWDDDEEYEELSDYVKQNYYIVGKYGDGKFVRIPKGRTVAVIQNAFEQMDNAVTGNDEVDLRTFLELVISNLAPNNPVDNNILSPIAQVKNNETWYGEDLVPTRLQDLPAEEQFDESTDAISKWLGEKLGVSPYKTNYLLDQYSGVVGDTFLPMLTPEAESGDNSIGGNMIAPLKDMFTTDSVMKNQNVSDFYEKVDELTANAKSSKATDEDVLKYKYMNTVNAELSTLYAKKREVQSSDLPDDEKYEEVRFIQSQIDELARNGLNSYDDVQIDGDYATVGDVQFRWYEPGEDSDGEAGWKKLTEKQSDKQDDVINGLGISASEYWSNKEEYDYAYESPEKYAVAKSVGGYEAYRRYSSELYDIKADKDENGDSIRGSRKEKVIEWMNNLDADYGTKIILFKSEYNADDTYNYDIIEYLNGRDDISAEEMETILKELGFDVSADGTISW